MDTTQSGLSADSTNTGGQSAPEGSTGTADSGGTSGQSAGSASNAGQTSDNTVPRSDFERIQAQLSAADRKRAEFEAELKAIRDKDLPEMERLKRDFEETSAKLAKAEEMLRTVQIQNAFLKDNTYAWHNPETALKLADMSAVNITDDGNVTGLKEALKRLADNNKYLLKEETSAGGDGGQGGANGAGGSAAPFTPPPAGARRDDPNNSKQQMIRRVPALRGRMG